MGSAAPKTRELGEGGEDATPRRVVWVYVLVYKQSPLGTAIYFFWKVPLVPLFLQLPCVGVDMLLRDPTPMTPARGYAKNTLHKILYLGGGKSGSCVLE